MSHANEFSPEDRRRQSETMKRFLGQVEGNAARSYSQGRIASTDDGDLAMAVAADKAHGVVILDFGKQVSWIGLPPDEVVKLCKLLMKRAAEVAGKSLTLEL